MKNSFTNGPKAERSVWLVGGTTLIAPRIDGVKEVRVGESSKNEGGESRSSTNPISSVGGLLPSDNKDGQQREKKPSLIERIKALSPRRGADADDDTGSTKHGVGLSAKDVFFSPDSVPPVASSSSAPKDGKIHSSISFSGDAITEKSASSSSHSSNRPKRRHVNARRKRSSSNSSRSKRKKSSQLFSSLSSLDDTSCALKLSSLDEGEEKRRRGGSCDVEVPDLEAALTPRNLGSKRKQHKEQQRSIAGFEYVSLYNHQQQQQLQGNHMNGIKRRRLSKRARTRLTMREVNSNIQPGRSDSVLEDSMGALEKRKAITLPKMIDFFLRIEIKLIAVNALVSVLLTILVLTAFPESWQTGLEESSRAVSLLGAFLSFALVFRTQSCYQRWWEARTQWGKMTATCVNVSGQALTWMADEELLDRFLTHCIIFPYACKAVLRGNALTSSLEEGPRFLQSGMLTDADLGVIVRHGTFPPFTCIDIMRKSMHEELLKTRLPSEAVNGAYLAMENSFNELYFNFGACAKIKSTQMPNGYSIFMRSFVFFFFILATLSWAPTTKYLTPIIIGFMVFLINTVIVIGDQMMRPFTLTWSGLPIQKFCVMIEQEILSVSRRQGEIERNYR